MCTTLAQPWRSVVPLCLTGGKLDPGASCLLENLDAYSRGQMCLNREARRPGASSARPGARAYHRQQGDQAVLPRKAKRQYLLTLQVSRYCLLALRNDIPGPTPNHRATHPT